MVLALKELSIRGDIRTTTEYIVQMMQSENFVHNDIDTSWLDKRIAEHAQLPTEHKHDPIKVVLSGAAVLAFQQAGKKADEYIDLLSKGQIPSESSVQVAFPMDVILNDVKYTLRCELCGPNAVTIHRSEEHTSELQSLMRISYAVFCLKKKNKQQQQTTNKALQHTQ